MTDLIVPVNQTRQIAPVTQTRQINCPCKSNKTDCARRSEACRREANQGISVPKKRKEIGCLTTVKNTSQCKKNPHRIPNQNKTVS